MRKWLLLGLGLCSMASTADVLTEPCDFASEEGKPFTFLPLSPAAAFDARNEGPIYPFWVKDRFNPSPINAKHYELRKAKIKDNRFYHRQEPSTLPGVDSTNVRYYEAISDHCRTIWIRVDEQLRPFSRFLDPDNHMRDGNLPWEQISSDLHIQLRETMFSLHSWRGKEMTILPGTDGNPLVGQTKGRDQVVIMDDYESVKLLDVEPDGFVLNGRLVSAHQIWVERNNGEKVLLPWSEARVAKGNPLKGKDVRQKYADDIRAGRIRFGMNKHEVKLAWGEPDKIRWLSEYALARTDGQWIKDDDYPYGGKFTLHEVLPPETKERIGRYQDWYYPERLPKSDKLIFDEEGELHERNQTIGSTKNSIYVPVAERPL